jgi:hypothetical protein
MSKITKTNKTVIKEGATIPMMHKKVDVPFKKGASIPELQPVTQQSSKPQTGSTQGNNSQNSTTSNSDKKK